MTLPLLFISWTVAGASTILSPALPLFVGFTTFVELDLLKYSSEGPCSMIMMDNDDCLLLPIDNHIIPINHRMSFQPKVYCLHASHTKNAGINDVQFCRKRLTLNTTKIAIHLNFKKYTSNFLVSDCWLLNIHKKKLMLCQKQKRFGGKNRPINNTYNDTFVTIGGTDFKYTRANSIQ